jgi:hypothetical protein
MAFGYLHAHLCFSSSRNGLCLLVRKIAKTSRLFFESIWLRDQQCAPAKASGDDEFGCHLSPDLPQPTAAGVRMLPLVSHEDGAGLARDSLNSPILSRLHQSMNPSQPLNDVFGLPPRCDQKMNRLSLIGSRPITVRTRLAKRDPPLFEDSR